MTTTTAPEIRITLDATGMGDGSTYADAEAYEAFVERRLVPGHSEGDRFRQRPGLAGSRAQGRRGAALCGRGRW